MQVSYVEHPCRFYVHRAEEVSEVEKLVRHISDWANEPRNIRHLSAANLNPGYMYAGKWEKVRITYFVGAKRQISFSIL